MSRFFLLLKRRVENLHNGVKSVLEHQWHINFHAPAFSRDFLKYLLKTQKIGIEIRIYALTEFVTRFSET